MIEEGLQQNPWPLSSIYRIMGISAGDLIVGTMPNLKQRNVMGYKPNGAFFRVALVFCLKERERSSRLFSAVSRKNSKPTIMGYCGSIGLRNNLHQLRTMYLRANESVLFVIAGMALTVQIFPRRSGQCDFIGRISDAFRDFETLRYPVSIYFASRSGTMLGRCFGRRLHAV